VNGSRVRTDILFTVQENAWNGTVTAQLNLKGIREVNDPRTAREIPEIQHPESMNIQSTQ
jgi:hypothetical protein